MTWVVVKFIESEEVEAVPSNWFNGSRQTVYYPPFPKNRIVKAIKNQCEPEEGWREYKVCLMRNVRYDSFKVACAKATKCCLTSEVSELDCLPEKRKSKKTYYSSDEESSDSDLYVPRLNTMKRNTSGSHEIVQVQSPLNEVQERSVMSELDINITDDRREDSCSFPTTDDQKFKTTVISMLVKNTKLLRDCESRIEELLNKVDSLTIRGGLAQNEPQEVAQCLDLFTDFPVKNLEELEKVENRLQDKEIHNYLVKSLCMLGGKDFKDCTRRFVRRILHDSLASQYSLQGHKNKKVFRSTRICSCILEAVQLSSGAQMKDIEVHLSAYLAKAKERLSRIEVSAGPSPSPSLSLN